MQKIFTLIGIVSVAFLLGWLGGRANLNRSRMEAGAGVYQDFTGSIDQLRGEVQSISTAVGEVADTTGRIAESVESGQRGLEKGIDGLRDLIADSEEAQSLAGGIGEDLADIGEASRGLADLFGVGHNIP